jgi:Nucleotidyl transferase AbiEii toxin, Type IV TA system
VTPKANLGASVRARLLNKARAEKIEFQLLLTRLALERLLYRLSISPHREQFLLKGALLFDLWFDEPHRPRRDADFLGFGPADLPTLAATFREISVMDVDDGIAIDPTSVKAPEIRKDANYAGIRITLMGLLDGARWPVQAGIGFGDAVTPAPEEIEYPVLLNDLPAPKLRAYPRYTAIAEKYEVITSLGIANSRMKDFFDLWVLTQHSTEKVVTVAATSNRRHKEQTRGSQPVRERRQTVHRIDNCVGGVASVLGKITVTTPSS